MKKKIQGGNTFEVYADFGVYATTVGVIIIKKAIKYSYLRSTNSIIELYDG